MNPLVKSAQKAPARPPPVRKPKLGGFSRLVVAISDRLHDLYMAAGDEIERHPVPLVLATPW